MTGFSAQLRVLIRLRSGGFCERCGLVRGAEMHHRRSRGMGGSQADDTNTASNALHLCSACHGWVTEHPQDARDNGWTVKSHQDPSEIPVKYRGAWVWLDDLGNMQRVQETL